jgi:hypothetical protein
VLPLLPLRLLVLPPLVLPLLPLVLLLLPPLRLPHPQV